MSIAQEIEKMEIKTGGRKEAVNANEETIQGERRKGEEGRILRETCVSCLEDDNECMVYVSYIVACARPL